MTFKEEMKERTEVIEKLLVKYLPKAEGYQSQIMEAMEYSVMAGGKRLRPMLMQETYRLFGGEGKEIEPFMAVWRRREAGISFYGSNGDDPYLFPGAR